MARCPKCGAERLAGATDCPECGVIYARVEEQAAKHRAATMATCPADDHQPAKPTHSPIAPPGPEKQKNSTPALLGCLGLIVLLCLVALISESGNNKTNRTSSNNVNSTDSQIPQVRRNVPITITKNANIFGCHDIDSYWLLREYAKSGDRVEFKKQLEARGDKCGFIAAGRGIAIEILPTGVAEIRDSRGIGWYVNDTALRSNGAY